MTTNDGHPNRSERRREQKLNPTWNEAEWGSIEFQEFDKCPACGCPNRFAMEAMRGETAEENLNAKPPAMGMFRFDYDTALYRISLITVVDSCCKCGLIYTVAREKRKTLLALLGPAPRRHA